MKRITVLVAVLAAMITGVVMANGHPAPIVRMVQQQSEMTWLQVNDDGQLIDRFGVISAEIEISRDGAAIEWRNGGSSTRYFEADWRERVELLATQAAEIAACERATFDRRVLCWPGPDPRRVIVDYDYYYAMKRAMCKKCTLLESEAIARKKSD